MDDAETLLQLSRIFQNMGADGSQAEVMAGQTLKRSRQLARERAITEIEALSYLLESIKRGREGLAPPDFPSDGGSSPTEK